MSTADLRYAVLSVLLVSILFTSTSFVERTLFSEPVLFTFNAKVLEYLDLPQTRFVTQTAAKLRREACRLILGIGVSTVDVVKGHLGDLVQSYLVPLCLILQQMIDPVKVVITVFVNKLPLIERAAALLIGPKGPVLVRCLVFGSVFGAVMHLLRSIASIIYYTAWTIYILWLAVSGLASGVSRCLDRVLQVL